MEHIFLGTGAGEAMPSPYCRCDYCQRARTAGAKNIRSRSSLRLDPYQQIDFSPDYFYQMQNLQLDLFDLKRIFITHTHEDHYYLSGIMDKDMAHVTNKDPVLEIYLSQAAADWTLDRLQAFAKDDPHYLAKWQKKYHLVPLPYYTAYQLADFTVSAVKANHGGYAKNELAINYLFEFANGSSLLYACDTGWYHTESWSFLTGKYVSCLVMECTYGGRRDRGSQVGGHLDILNFNLMLEKMSQIGLIDHNTLIYASHINHRQPYLHDELQAAFDQLGFAVQVAYDGMRINTD